MTTTFMSIFEKLEDPRIERKKKYPLGEILLVAFATILGGGDGYEDMEYFGNAKLNVLNEILPFKNGIPSDDTFGRVFELINPKKFQQLFMEWVKTLCSLNEKIIGIDGKTIRGSASPKNKVKPLHLVNAWACENRMALGFKKVDEKSNEITAVPEILKLLSLKGTTVTMDAMGCQTVLAQQIVDQEGDFVISLKGNQSSLLEDVKTFFELDSENKDIEKGAKQTEKGHGRIETREYGFCPEIAWLQKEHPKWAMVQSIGYVVSTRIVGDTTTKERRYFISSLQDSEKFAVAVRAHWGIENSLHWTLDVILNEDSSRIRAKNAVENLAIIRRAVLNVVSLDTKSKTSKRIKRLRAGWDDEYLKMALNQQF